MQEAPPADDVRLQASTAHVHHHCAHLTRLTSLGPCLDEYVAQAQRGLQTKWGSVSKVYRNPNTCGRIAGTPAVLGQAFSWKHTMETHDAV